MSTYQAERDAEKAQEGCCSCFGYLLATGAIVWFLSGYLGFWKAILVAVVMTLATWLLAFFGVIPFLGQWAYKLFAKDILIWIYGLLNVNPDIQLIVPKWINTVLKWIAGAEEVTGSLASYTFAVGYTLSILASFGVVVAIIIGIVRKVALRQVEED